MVRLIQILVLGAAVVVVALITTGGIVYGVSQPPSVATVAMAPQDQHVITARMSITPQAWGTRFDWSCSYHDNVWSTPASYDLIVTTKSGKQTKVATWTSTGPHAAGLSASSDIAFGDISSVEIRLTGSTSTLLRETL